MGLVPCEICLFTAHLFLELTVLIPRGMARLSWPGWLATYQDGLTPQTVTHPSTSRAWRQTMETSEADNVSFVWWIAVLSNLSHCLWPLESASWSSRFYLLHQLQNVMCRQETTHSLSYEIWLPDNVTRRYDGLQQHFLKSLIPFLRTL